MNKSRIQLDQNILIIGFSTSDLLENQSVTKNQKGSTCGLILLVKRTQIPLF